MYCRNCGRYISDPDKEICDECLAMKAVEKSEDLSRFPEKATDTIACPVKSRLACGILSTVAGQVAFIVLYINIVVSLGRSFNHNSISGIPALTWITLFLSIAGGALGVVAIRNFSNARKTYGKKPVATLVTGIVGSILCILSFLFQAGIYVISQHV